MKKSLLIRLAFVIALLYANMGMATAQTYTVSGLLRTAWSISLVDLNYNPVTTPLPNTSYYLRIRLNSGVSCPNIVLWSATNGDGWYRGNPAFPTTFPSGQDVPYNAQVNPSREIYYGFTTVGSADFSGAYFVIRAADGYTGFSQTKSVLFQ